MASLKVLLCVLAVALTVSPLCQAADEHVTVLTSANFEDFVGGDKAALVEFYAPWCGHCKRLAPEYEKLGEALKGQKGVVIAKVDCDDHKSVCSKFGIQGFPTIKWFPKGSLEPKDYSGGRTTDALLEFVNNEAGTKGKVTTAPSEVVILTPANFDKIVLDPSKDVLVEFFAPWCGHCKKLAPTWEELADSLASSSSKVLIAKVDGDAHKELSSRFSISGFPTLKWFDGKSATPEDYNGGRDLEALQEFIATKTGAKPKRAAKAPSSILQLGDSDFEKSVGGEKGVFVAFTAPWCGHCKSLKPTWEQLALDFTPESHISIAQVDAEANPSIASKFGVQGYPTLKFFPAGSSTPVDYSGGRDEKSLVDYVNSQTGTRRVVGGGLDLTAGTIEALDLLVEKMTGGSSNLETVTGDLKEAAKGLKDQYAAYYVKVLDKLSVNQGYIEKESKRLEGLLRKGGLSREKLDDLTSRVNILKKFVVSGGKSEF